jgi:hypothetical protein
MIVLLLQLIIVAVILGAILMIASLIPGIQPFLSVIRILVICVFIVYCLYILIALLGGGHTLPFR